MYPFSKRKNGKFQQIMWMCCVPQGFLSSPISITNRIYFPFYYYVIYMSLFASSPHSHVAPHINITHSLHPCQSSVLPKFLQWISLIFFWAPDVRILIEIVFHTPTLAQKHSYNNFTSCRYTTFRFHWSRKEKRRKKTWKMMVKMHMYTLLVLYFP